MITHPPVIRYKKSPPVLPKSPSFLLLGHSGHGASRAAYILRDRLGLPLVDASEMAARVAVWPELRFKYRYLNPAACFDDRANHRQEWKDAIAKYNKKDPARLVKAVLKSSHFYAGLRAMREYRAAYHLFDHVLWLDASKRAPLEPTMEIEYDPECMVFVDNNGPKERLPTILALAVKPLLAAKTP